MFFTLLTKGFVRKDESFCTATIGLLIGNLLDAKLKCRKISYCVGFYDKYGSGNTFYLCSDGAEITPSSASSIMYIKDG